MVIDTNILIADHAATFRRQYRLELPDAIIAATAHFRHVPLVTRDHAFKKVKEITIIEL